MLDRPLDRPQTDTFDKLLDFDLTDSVALQRLIEEVRADPMQPLGASAYNRTYHRHNR